MSGAGSAQAQHEAAEAVPAAAFAAAAARSLARSGAAGVNDLPDALLGRIMELAAKTYWLCVPAANMSVCRGH